MTRNSTRLSMLVAAIVIFWSTLSSPALADTVSFVARRDYEAGQSAVSVVVGDFNGDGVPDLAVANGLDLNLSGGTVEVLLGKDDGTFQAARTVVAARARRTSVVVGDFTGDGVPDLAVANGRAGFAGGPGNIEVLLGDGDGTFQERLTVATGGRPVSLAPGDFNGDGKPDLAVADFDSNTVLVLLGNGDGTFQAALTVARATGPRSIVVGDFNGDGKPDLAVANFGSNTVSVLLGNGDGTFQAPLTVASATGPRSVAVGDFNGDGTLDLAVADWGSNTVSVLLGNGDGTFQAPRTFTTGARPSSVAAGDFNGDGALDLAVANEDSFSVSVLLGNGDGTFQVPSTFTTGARPQSVAVGDFDRDGTLDLAVAAEAGFPALPGNVSVRLGNGDGTFEEARTFSAGERPRSVAVGDLHRDGKPDLARASQGFWTPGNVAGLRGNGDGTFQAPLSGAPVEIPPSGTVDDVYRA